MMLVSVSRRKVGVTEASKTHWGTLCNSKIAFDSRANPMMKWHIKHLEMMAVILAFKEFMMELRVHVLGSSNIGADMLSHGGLPPGEWKLYPQAVHTIW